MDVSLNELQEMVMDRAAGCAVIHGVAKSLTRLSDWTALNWTLDKVFFWDLELYYLIIHFKNIMLAVISSLHSQSNPVE